MSTVSATNVAKARPAAFKPSQNKDVSEYFTLIEKALRQIQDQVGSTSGKIDLGPIVEQASISLQQNGASGKELISTAVAITTYASSIIVVTSPVDITLNQTPDDQEEVSIQHFTSGRFNVIGNINDQSQITMTGKGDCLDLVYIAELERWIIV